MDSAFCMLSGRDYTGPEFAALSDNDRSTYRRHLVCTACKTPAYFRKEAKSGQGPCFGARPHTNCSLATPETARGIGGGGEEQEIVNNPGTHIVIDTVQGGSGVPNTLPSDGTGSGSRGGRFTGSGGQRSAVSHRRLRPLLKTLIYSPAFRASSQTIEVPDRGVWAARDLFVNFSEVATCRHGEFHGFWGEIYDTGNGADGSLWINTGDQEVVSIPIAATNVASFLERHKVKKAELDGMHFLVFGTLNRSQFGKLFIRPADINLTALNDD